MMASVNRILLAEDNDNDLELTLAAFKEHNISNVIDVVRDGAEAIDYLYRQGKYSGRDNGNPALVLLDIKMPKVDGIEVLRKIKSDENLKTVPTVILTSSQEEKDIVESYKIGVNAYVLKPVNFNEFFSSVEKLGVFWAFVNIAPR